MPQLDRITFDPNVMGGKPCIRGTPAALPLRKSLPTIRTSKRKTFPRRCRMLPGGLKKLMFRSRGSKTEP